MSSGTSPMRSRISRVAWAFAVVLLWALALASTAAAEPLPEPTIVTPTNGTATSIATPSFAGTTDDLFDGVALTVHSGSSVEGPEVLTTVPVLPGPGGEWSVELPTPLAEGTYTAQASQTDAALEIGSSAPVTFTVDTTAPVVSLNSVPSPGRNPTPLLSGDAGTVTGPSPDSSTVTVTVYEGGSVGGPIAASESVEVTGAGAWSFSTPHLADGTYTAQVEQSDAVGNVGVSLPVAFIVDTTAPVVSLKAVPSPSKNATPLLTGSAGSVSGSSPDSSTVTVTVYEGGSVGGPVAASGGAGVTGGAWSFSTPHLADGTYTARVEQSDAAGNVGVSLPATFTIDTTPPAVSLTALPAVTNNATPLLFGNAGIAAGDAKIVTVAIRTSKGALVASGSPSVKEGTWSFSPSKKLPDGTYTAQAEQTDEVDNVGLSMTATFTIDTTKPAVTLDPKSVPSPSNDSTPTFKGTAGTVTGLSPDATTVTVRVYEGNAVGGTVAASGSANVVSGAWSLTPPHLADGTYTAQAEQTDAAENKGVSQPVTFTIDTAAPAVTIDAVPSPSNDSTPNLSGGAGTVSGVSPDASSVAVKVYEGGSVGGPVAASGTSAVKAGGWSFTTPHLKDGTYTAQAEQADAAGNVGVSTPPVTFRIDTVDPTVTLQPPAKFIASHTLSLSGSASGEAEAEPTVTVKIYKGSLPSGETAEPPIQVPVIGGATWVAEALGPLPDGTYTAEAEQADKVDNVGHSEPATFTIDTTPPRVTIDTPASGSSSSGSSQLVAGAAESAPGDSRVTIRLFAGETVGEPAQALQELTVPASGASWSATFAGLAPGTYTVQAEQADEVKNVGVSNSVTFTVGVAGQPPPSTEPPVTTNPPPVAPGPPAVSFTWSPATPKVGESVALVSTSTDPESPIVAIGWALSVGAFQAGEPVLHTSFSSAGTHPVQLRVTNAAGLSSIATQTIDVVALRASLMQPFPVVRLAGRDTATGVRLRLLTVQAPANSTITVVCKGPRCPAKSESRVARASKAGVSLVAFPHFERTLRAGVVLQIRVSKAGEIGKYTRFTVRRNRLPERVDMCLPASGVKPIACPS